MENVNVDGNGILEEKNSEEIKKEKVELIKKDMTGEVKFFNRVLGWGFIIQDSNQPDAFVHYSWIVSDKRYKNLDNNDFVIYDLYKISNNGNNKPKLQARNVRKIPDTLL